MNFQGLEFDGVPTDSDNILDDNESISSLVDEDVDFGYVYALLQFTRMVDGQLTVQDGEKLTLLDDSNSYWWLVQNLHDNQMGYIPADNIESAFGKLARVNRRKNLRLCKPDPEHIMNSRSAPAVPPFPDKSNRKGKNASNGKQKPRVKFDDKLVTQVFISDPITDDEDEYDDEDYAGYEDYDYEEDEEDVNIQDEITSRVRRDSKYVNDNNVHVTDVSNDHHSEFGQVTGDGQGDGNDSDSGSDDYSYYYSSNAGKPDPASDHSDMDQDMMDPPATTRHAGGIAPLQASNSTASGANSGRRVSIAPNHMGQILGEHLGDDSDGEGDDKDEGSQGGRSGANPGHGSHHYGASHEGDNILSRMVSDPAADYYPANEDSDDGDSLTGALDSRHGSSKPLTSSTGANDQDKYTLRILHVDAQGSPSGETIHVLVDEMFGEVLRRSLGLFHIPQNSEPVNVLYAQLERREGELMTLHTDTSVDMFMNHLRKAATHSESRASYQIGESGAVGSDLCTLVLSEKSTSHSLIFTAIATASSSSSTVNSNRTNTSSEDDPYMGIGSGSRSILRTSVAASVSEGISALAPSVTTSPSVSISYDLKDSSMADNDSGLLACASVVSSNAGDGTDTRQTISAEDINGLPDSRKVVQGLLRSIPPPKSRPPQSAINRAKRNTVQLSAQGSIVDESFQVSPTMPDASNRPASTCDQMSPPSTSSEQAAVPASMVSPLQTTSNNGNQALGQSSSTLRPSSDTFTNEDEGNSSDGEPADVAASGGDNDDIQGSTPTEPIHNHNGPISPASSSDTASIQHNESNSGADSAAAATQPLAGPASASFGSGGGGHRHIGLKDTLIVGASASDPILTRNAAHGGATIPVNGGGKGLRHSVHLANGVTAPSTDLLSPESVSVTLSDELSLDDWLAILHGWNDTSAHEDGNGAEGGMAGSGNSTAAFYQSFVKDLESLEQQPTDSSEMAAFMYRQISELKSVDDNAQLAIDDILGVSQGVGRRLDTLEREVDDIARYLVQAN